MKAENKLASETVSDPDDDLTGLESTSTKKEPEIIKARKGKDT